MSAIKILVVEDHPDDLDNYRSTTSRYRHQHSVEIELKECTDVDEAIEALDNSFDGAVIDITLKGDREGGNKIIEQIEASFVRIPVFVLTGTPSWVPTGQTLIQVLTKGEENAGFDKLLDRFLSIHATGLTRILGGRGTIETELSRVFQSSILPRIASWESHGQADPDNTEKALLRHVLSHLVQVVDEDVEKSLPEEFYLCPPPSADIRTGSVLEKKGGGNKFVVLTPACDLVIRKNGKRNAERVVLVEVIGPEKLPYGLGTSGFRNLTGSKKENLEKAMGNRQKNCFHCLPKTEDFDLSFLDFTRVSTALISNLKKEFEMPPKVQISPPFVKDIVARFSSFYARQGQPEVDFRGYFTS